MRAGRRTWRPQTPPTAARRALARQVPGRAIAIRGVDGDVEAGEAHQLIGIAEPAGIADLGPHDRRR